jgi:hypothetical protein
LSSPGCQTESRTRHRRARWYACTLFVLVFTCWPSSRDADADGLGATETGVKSAFLYKFTHFANWPPETMGEAGDPFAMCVMGRNELADVLEHAVDGRTARDRPLVVKRIENVQQTRGCHLLFIGWSKLEKIERILGALGRQPTLTVGDVKGFARRGGMINLTKDGRRLRFEINRRAAERAGIHLSSQLLKLANLVHDDGGTSR